MQSMTKINDIIYIGNTRCIVSNVYSPQQIQVAYINSTGTAVAEAAILKDGKWDFTNPNSDASYCHLSDELRPFIAKLKNPVPRNEPTS